MLTRNSVAGKTKAILARVDTSSQPGSPPSGTRRGLEKVLPDGVRELKIELPRRAIEINAGRQRDQPSPRLLPVHRGKHHRIDCRLVRPRLQPVLIEQEGGQQ